MNKKIIILVVVLLFFGGVLVWKQKNTSEVWSPETGTKKIKVVASFYPLQFFAQQVGGDNIELVTLTPAGSEPHDYEPTPQDIIKIQTADVLLLNGAGLEVWAQKLLPQLAQEKVKVVMMSDHVNLMSGSINGEGEPEPGFTDPHMWLDPVQAQKEVEIIRDTLITLDPAHSEHYTKNATTLVQNLALLDTQFQDGLSVCQQHETITSHNAFQYLAQRYHFISVPIAGFSPTEDPAPKHLAELVKLVQEKNIQYVFTETLASPKFSDTLAKETKVKTLVLNPIEGLSQQDVEQGKNYLTVMKENLQNLRLAMECQ